MAFRLAGFVGYIIARPAQVEASFDTCAIPYMLPPAH